MIGVKKEEVLPLFPLFIVSVLSQKNWIWYSQSQQLLDESFGDIVLLVVNYYLLQRVTYFYNLKLCDWCWGESTYIISTVYYFLFFIKIIYPWYFISQHLLYESVGDIVLLIEKNYLLQRVTYCYNFECCDWCWGGSSYIISTVYYSCSF